MTDEWNICFYEGIEKAHIASFYFHINKQKIQWEFLCGLVLPSGNVCSPKKTVCSNKCETCYRLSILAELGE